MLFPKLAGAERRTNPCRAKRAWASESARVRTEIRAEKGRTKAQMRVYCKTSGSEYKGHGVA